MKSSSIRRLMRAVFGVQKGSRREVIDACLCASGNEDAVTVHGDTACMALELGAVFRQQIYSFDRYPVLFPENIDRRLLSVAHIPRDKESLCVTVIGESLGYESL